MTGRWSSATELLSRRCERQQVTTAFVLGQGPEHPAAGMSLKLVVVGEAGQMRAVPSNEAVSRRVLSCDQATDATLSWWTPTTAISSMVEADQTRTVRSSEPVARYWPSGDQATVRTRPS